MKAFRFFSALLMSVLVVTAVSCGDDEEPVDTFIPNLSAAPNWVNVNDAADQMTFFNIPTPPPATSTFSGNRNRNSQSEGFAGSYNHSAIELTFTGGPNSGRVFSGNINGGVTPQIISLTSPAAGANAAISLQFKR